MTLILVIESEELLLTEICALLQSENYETVSALSCENGLRLAHEFCPNLIILDNTALSRDKDTFLQTLRNDTGTASIPLVIIKPKTEFNDQLQTLDKGQFDFITEPFTSRELLDIIQNRLEKETSREIVRLNQFNRQLVRSHDLEMIEIAQRLEDVFRKRISGLKMLLMTTESLTDSEFHSTMNRVTDIVSELIIQLDLIVMDLSPTLLDCLGLLPALLWYTQQFTHRTGIPVEFTHQILDIPFENSIKLALVRIVQEALEATTELPNINRARVHLWTTSQQLRGEIKNECSTDILDTKNVDENSFRFISMIARAQSVGGSLRIVSAPETGASISIYLPLSGIQNHENRALSLKDTLIKVPTSASLNAKNAENGRKASLVTREHVSILIAEDLENIQKALRENLECQLTVYIVGTTDSACEVIQLLEELKPDILLLDLDLPGGNSLDVIRQTSAFFSKIRVIALGSSRDPARIWDTLDSGAFGYILKTASAEDILAAIAHVSRGERYLGTEISSEVFERYIAKQDGDHEDSMSETTLTRREMEILQLVASGKTSDEIASALTISVRTVESHRANLMRKLNVHNRVELTLYAVARGLILLNK